MGMRVNSAGASAAQGSAGVGQWRQRQQGMKDLMSALQSGDLATAQKAFSVMSSGQANATKGSSPLAQLGQALQSGDLTAARQAAQTWQAARAGHHHGEHGAGSVASPVATATPSGTGSLVNLTA